MSLGILIYTGESFAYEEKLVYLNRCVNSIHRQQQPDVQIIALCSNTVPDAIAAIEDIGIRVQGFDDLAAGINAAIRSLDTSHFMIVRYDAIFAPLSIELFQRCKSGTSMVFNLSVKPHKGVTLYEPIYDKTSQKNQLRASINVWNMTFDRKTVVNHKLLFFDFRYVDHYLFVMKYMALCKKVHYRNAVLLCVDRALKTQVTFDEAFFRSREEDVLDTAKKVKACGDAALLAHYVSAIGAPLIASAASCADDETRQFLRDMSKRFMDIMVEE